MDRSRRQGAKETEAPPSSSRINMRAKAGKNRRRPPSLWSRMPPPRVVVDACGRALRRALPVAAATAAACLVGGGVYAGYRFLTTSPRFAVADIQITQPAHAHEKADDLRMRLPVHLGDNVFGADLGAIQTALLADPWIASADARRVLPNTISIEVREHVPAAMVDFASSGSAGARSDAEGHRGDQIDGLYLVEADGHAFKHADLAEGDGAGLPIITGLARDAYKADPEGSAKQIQTALSTLATWRSVGERPAIGEVHVDPHGAITLRTYDDAVAIQLGTPSPEIEARMQTFDAAWADLDDSERARARAIHVDTQPDHVTVAFNTQAAALPQH